MRHHVRFHPDAQAVVASHDHHVAHARDAENLRLEVDTDVVGQESLVVRVVRAVEREHLQDTRLPLRGGDTHLVHLRGELSRGFGDPVLHVHRRHVRVGSLFKVDSDGDRSGVGGAGGHIRHVLHSVDGLFERGDDTLLQRLRAGSEVAGGDHDGWRGDIRVLFDGQRKQPDDPDHDDGDGDNGR